MLISTRGVRAPGGMYSSYLEKKIKKYAPLGAWYSTRCVKLQSPPLFHQSLLGCSDVGVIFLPFGYAIGLLRSSSGILCTHR